MIDYVNTEIVQYSENIPSNVPTFNEAYPYTLPPNFNAEGTGNFGNKRSYIMRIVTDFSLSSEVVSEFSLESDTIYAFLITHYQNITFREQSAIDYVGVCYYGFTGYNVDIVDGNEVPRQGVGNGTYIRIPFDDLPVGIVAPFGHGVSSINGTDIYWLYNLGDYLTYNGVSFSDLLNKDINGVSLLSLMFGVGFFIYVGWVVLKWVIPL